MNNPQNYPRRILLAVCGMSPQIVTETLYGLAVAEKNQPFVPTEVHLITTQSGAKEARLQLLHAKTGMFLKLCQDYQLTGIDFTEDSIHVIEDAQGEWLNDIQTPAQNEAAADFITEIVRKLTHDANSALHVSIAGGRKTMGYYLGYALSLYGRDQDRLSHVLVTDRYESLRDFFYPTPESHVIFDRQEKSLDAKDAEVMLAEIPFVRLRGGIPGRLLEGKTSFNESISFARRIAQEPMLKIDLNTRIFWVEDVKIKLPGIKFEFYLWILDCSHKGKSIERSVADKNEEYTEDFKELFQRVNKSNKKVRVPKFFKEGMESQWISENITHVNGCFEEALGTNIAKIFSIQSSGKNNNVQYFITLTDAQICFT